MTQTVGESFIIHEVIIKLYVAQSVRALHYALSDYNIVSETNCGSRIKHEVENIVNCINCGSIGIYEVTKHCKWHNVRA